MMTSGTKKQAAPKPQNSEFKLSNFNVLIVDDAPVNLGVLVTFLEKCGLGIRIARSGESALKRVQYELPDIILLDVLMTGMDGFETCRKLKSNPLTKEIPVIFLTSLTGVDDKIKGFEAGGVDYVTKPLHQEEVLSRITTHLKLKEMTNQLKEQHQSLQETSEQEKAELFEEVQQQRKQLRLLNKRLNEVKEAEHKQLARELHDQLGQSLTAVQINLAAVKQELNGHLSQTGKERLSEAETLTGNSLARVRELSLDLRPPMLDDLGLVPTVRWYVKRYAKRLGIKADLHLDSAMARLAADTETNLYRIVQEGLTNIAKYANATQVSVSIQPIEHHVVLAIEDNGSGFEKSKLSERKPEQRGTGIIGIQERALMLDGDVDIDTSLGKGTVITVTVPLSVEP